MNDIEKTTPAEFISAATLFDYKLAFTRYSQRRRGGVVDVIKSSGDYVEGVLFKVSNLKALDAREGHPFCYKRKKVKVLVHNKPKLLDVWTYEVTYKESFEIRPTKDYLDLIREGARQFLSQEYQRDLEQNFRRFRAPYNLPSEYERSYDLRQKSLSERLGFH
jgi:hypothetical protein